MREECRMTVGFSRRPGEVYAKTVPPMPERGDTGPMLAFDPAVLLPLLRCPKSHAPLRLVGEECLVSTDAETRLCYPIADGIPVLLEEEATALEEGDWKAMLARADAISPTTPSEGESA